MIARSRWVCDETKNGNVASESAMICVSWPAEIHHDDGVYVYFLTTKNLLSTPTLRMSNAPRKWTP